MAAFDRVLVLETAGRVGQVALAAGDAIVREARLGEARRRASDLALAVDRLLKEQGWTARELDRRGRRPGPRKLHRAAGRAGVGQGPGVRDRLRRSSASRRSRPSPCGRRPNVESVSVIADALQGKLFRRDYRRTASRLGARRAGWKSSRRSEWLASLRPGIVGERAGGRCVRKRLPEGVRVANTDECESRGRATADRGAKLSRGRSRRTCGRRSRITCAAARPRRRQRGSARTRCGPGSRQTGEGG